MISLLYHIYQKRRIEKKSYDWFQENIDLPNWAIEKEFKKWVTPELRKIYKIYLFMISFETIFYIILAEIIRGSQNVN